MPKVAAAVTTFSNRPESGKQITSTSTTTTTMALTSLSSEELQVGLELQDEEKLKDHEEDGGKLSGLTDHTSESEEEPATSQPTVQILGATGRVFSERRIFSSVKIEGSEIAEQLGWRMVFIKKKKVK